MSALKYFLLGTVVGVVGIGAAAIISEKFSDSNPFLGNHAEEDEEFEEDQIHDSTDTQRL